MNIPVMISRYWMTHLREFSFIILTVMLIKLTILNKKTLLHLNYIAFLPEGNIYAINKTRSNANKENK